MLARLCLQDEACRGPAVAVRTATLLRGAHHQRTLLSLSLQSLCFAMFLQVSGRLASQGSGADG